MTITMFNHLTFVFNGARLNYTIFKSCKTNILLGEKLLTSPYSTNIIAEDISLILGTLTISGTARSNGWYRSDVTFKVNNGSDNISSHSSTISTHTGISKETSGIKITVIAKNQAGLIATRDYDIKIDKTAPTIAFGISGNLGKTAVINCSDTLSGMANSSKQTTQTLSGTADKTIQGSCTDQAGNKATSSHTYKYNPCKTGFNTCQDGNVKTNCSDCYYGSPSECQGGYVQGGCSRYKQAKCSSSSCVGACYDNGVVDNYYCATNICTQYEQVWDNCATTKNTCSYGCDSEYDSCKTGSNTCQCGFNLN